jgi:hypothetical protein
VIIRFLKSNIFEVYAGDTLLGAVHDSIDISYVVERNWDEELKKTYDVDELARQG